MVIKKPKVEKWRDVVGYEGWYSVSNWGRVMRVKGARSTVVGRILKPALARNYPRISLHKDGKRTPRRIHILVAQAFCKNSAGPGADVHHRNTIKTCNWSTNLQWLSPQKHRGEQMNGRAKLTREQVRELKWRYRQGGISCRELAREYRVSDVNISVIVNRKGWKQVVTPKETAKA